jgi:hypothetical protein
VAVMSATATAVTAAAAAAAAPVLISIQDFLGNSSKSGKYDIGDLLSNINQANLILLRPFQDSIASIAQTCLCTGPIKVSFDELVLDTNLLGKITSPYTLAVSNVSSDQLNTLTASTTGLFIFTNPKIISVSISDTPANIAAHLEYFQTNNAKITSIVQTEAGPIPITLAQLSSNLALALINDGTYTLSIPTITIAEFKKTPAVLTNTHIVPFAVSDTASNIAANLATLQTNLNKFSAITIASGTLEVTGAQLTSAAGVLALINNSLNVSTVLIKDIDAAYTFAQAHNGLFSISDSSANIAAGLASGALTAAVVAKIKTITQTSPAAALVINLARLISDGTIDGANGVANTASFLLKFNNAYTLAVSGVAIDKIATAIAIPYVTKIAIVDSSESIKNNWDLLKTNITKISSIAQTDAVANPALSITATQLIAVAGVLSLLSNTSYKLAVADVLVAGAAGVAGNKNVSSFTIKDSAANIGNGLHTIQTTYSSKLGRIDLTEADAGKTFDITAKNLSLDASTLAKISNSYYLNVIGGVTVADAIAEKTAVVPGVFSNDHVLTFTISDSSASIAASLHALQTNSYGNKLTAITQTGTPAPLAITLGQISADSGALAKITNAYTLAVSGVAYRDMLTTLATAKVDSISISDTSAVIAANLDAIQAKISSGAKITGIVQTGTAAPLAITATSFANDTLALSKIVGTYALAVSGVAADNVKTTVDKVDAAGIKHVTTVLVADSSFNIAKKLDFLQDNNAKITSITQTGTATALGITAKSLADDVSVLNKINNTYTLAVSDVFAAKVATTLATTFNYGTVSKVSVKDSSLNIANNLDALHDNLSNITTITKTVAATALDITATQLSRDADVLTKIGTYTLTVSGVAADKVGITLGLVNPVGGAKVVTTISVTDSSNSIQTNFNTLQANILKITSITQAVATDVIQISASQLLLAANGVLAKLNISNPTNVSNPGSGYKLIVTDVLVTATSAKAGAAGVSANGHVNSFTINDSSANIATSLSSGALAGYSNKLTAITQAGTASALGISATKLFVNAAVDNNVAPAIASVLAKISGTYTLAVSGVTLATVGNVCSNGSVASITIFDSSANIAAGLDNLQKLYSTKLGVGSIIQTVANVPLNITATQLATNGEALAKISNASYKLVVSDVLVTATAATTLVAAVAGATGANGVFSNSHVSSFTIKDSVANIVANLAALQTSSAGLLKGITLTDTTQASNGIPMSITGAQLVTYTATLNKITSPYSLTITGGVLTGAQEKAAAANTHVASFVVTDSFAKIISSMADLKKDVAKISAITLTDTGTPTAQLTLAQLSNVSSVLAKIPNSSLYTLTIPALTIAALTTDIITMITAGHIAKVIISDTAANIVSKLAFLQTNVLSIASITKTDTTAPLVITQAQLDADHGALSLVSGGYAVDGTIVTGVSIAQMVGTLNGTGNVSLTISDSSANISTYLKDHLSDFTAANINRINSIILTDSLPFAITSARFISDGTNAAAVADTASVLGKISAKYTLAVSGVAADKVVTTLAKVVGPMGTVANVSVSDSSTKIATNLDTLQTKTAQITSIALTGTASLLDITAKSLADDVSVLNKITNNFTLSVSNVLADKVATTLATVFGTKGSVANVFVNDTSANIALKIDALQAKIGQITEIKQQDATAALTINATQLIADSGILDKINASNSGYKLIVKDVLVTATSQTAGALDVFNNPKVNTFTIKDSSANITAVLDTLQTTYASKLLVKSITLTNPTTAIDISATKLISNKATLDKINDYKLVVSDVLVTATNAKAAAPGVTAVAAVAGVDGVFKNPKVNTFTIKDSSANIAAVLDKLQTTYASKLLAASITQTDASAPLKITATQLIGDAQALAKIVNTNYKLNVIDVLVTAKIAQAAAPKVAAVAGVAGATEVFSNANVNTFTIKDSSANIFAGLDALQAAITLTPTKLISITQTDPKTVIAITATKLIADASALTKIDSNYQLNVSGVLVTATATEAGALPIAGVSGVISNSHVKSFTINDTSANIANNINALQTHITKINGFTQTDPSAALTISATQLIASASVLAKINVNNKDYKLIVTDVLVAATKTTAGAEVVNKDSHVNSFTIKDSSANIAKNLNALQAFTTSSTPTKLSSISLADISEALKITATQLTNDAGALALISGAYKLAVSDVTAAAATATVAGIFSNSNVTSVAIKDTSDSIANNIDALQAKIALGKITGIVQTVATAALTISATQLNADAGVIAQLNISNPNYKLVVTGAHVTAAAGVPGVLPPTTTTAGVTGLYSNTHINSFTISDSSVNIFAGLAALKTANTSKPSLLTSITLTDPSAVVAISATNLTSNTSVLNKIIGEYHLTVSDVLVTGTSRTAGVAVLAGVNFVDHITSYTIKDTSASIAGNWDLLHTNAAKITNITQTDVSTALNITATQLIADADVVTKLNISNPTNVNIPGSGYKLIVSDVLVTGTATKAGAFGDAGVFSNTHVKTFTIKDSSANIATNLNALQTYITANVNKLTSITPAVNSSIQETGAYEFYNAYQWVGRIWQLGTELQLSTYLGAGSVYVVHPVGGFTMDTFVLAYQNASGYDSLPYTLSVNAAGNGLRYTFKDSSGNYERMGMKLYGDNTFNYSVSAAPEAISITATQFKNDAGAIALISGVKTLAVSEVTIAVMVGNVAAANVAANAAILTNPKVASISISDSYANIASNLDVLQTKTAQITSIALTGTASALVITAKSLADDVSVLNKISDNFTLSVSNVLADKVGTTLATALTNGTVTQVSVTDTSAKIVANIDALQAKIGQITSITQTATAALALTATQLSNNADVLTKIGSANYTLTVSGVAVGDINAMLNPSVANKITSITISDTSANIAASLDVLQTYVKASKITAISQTGNASPLAITATSFAKDTDALAKIGSTNYRLTVSEVSATATTFNAVLANKNVDSISIIDSSANIANNLDALQAKIMSGAVIKITNIEATDTNALTITQAQLVSADLALTKICSGNAFIISAMPFAQMAGVLHPINPNNVEGVFISDSSANIGGVLGANLDALQANIAKIKGIVVTGAAPIAISATQYISDASALGKITSAYKITVSDVKVTETPAAGSTAKVVGAAEVYDNTQVQSFTIKDTGANISNYLDTLQSQSNKITGITSSDGLRISLSINSATKISNNAVILQMIKVPYTITVTQPIAASQISMVLGNLNVIPVNVSDSSVNIAGVNGANLDAIQDSLTRISSITLTGTDRTIAISATQLTRDSLALTKIGLGGSYTLAVSGVTAAAAIASGGNLSNDKVVSISISDSSTNIVGVNGANLNAIQAIITSPGGSNKITSIVPTDTGTIAITATQLITDAQALSKITGGKYAVSEVLVAATADVAGVFSNANVTKINITDSSANIAAGLHALQTNSNASKLQTIHQTSVAPLAITRSQISDDSGALAKIDGGAYTLAVSGVTYSQMLTTLNTAKVASISLSDTLANIVGVNGANLVAIQDRLSLNGVTKITSIVQTSGATAVMNITWDQLTNNAGALNAISNDYKINIPAITISQMNNSVLLNTHVNPITIIDTSANITTSLNFLKDNYLKISTITATDTVPLALTHSQLIRDGAALNLLLQSNPNYKFTVTGAAISDLSTLITNIHLNPTTNNIGSISITDTISSFKTNLSGLHDNVNAINTITFSDSGPHVLGLTMPQAAAEFVLLGKIQGSYSLQPIKYFDISTINGGAKGYLDNYAIVDATKAVIKDSKANFISNIVELNNKIDKIQSQGIQLTDTNHDIVLPVVPVGVVSPDYTALLAKIIWTN